VPSVLLLFLCELFLLEGLSPVSAAEEDSLLPDFSALEDFFELFKPFVPELDEASSDEDSALVPVPPVISSPF